MTELRACVFLCVAELATVKTKLCELANLSQETRSHLLQLLDEILPDQTLLSTLEHKLEKICDGSTDDYPIYWLDSSHELADNFLHVLQSETDHMDSQRQLILTAIHMLISAAAGKQDEICFTL